MRLNRDVTYMKRKCGIHQPNFFPWLGYFYKIMKSDVFVVMDSVQLPRTGRGSYVNRSSFIIAQTPKWATAPIVRGAGYPLIRDIRFHESNWRERLWRTIEQNYTKAPFFEKYADSVRNLVMNTSEYLWEYNLHAIRQIAQLLGISTSHFVLMSEMGINELSSNELLIAITHGADCEVYLAGDGADGYMRQDLFEKNGLILERTCFQHPEYTQRAEVFHAGQSSLDYLFNAHSGEISFLEVCSRK